MLACYRRKSQFEVLNYLEYIAWSASAYWNIILFCCNNNFAMYLTFLISEKTINSYIYWRISYRFIQSEGIIWFTSAKVWNSPYGKRGFSQSQHWTFYNLTTLESRLLPRWRKWPLPSYNRGLGLRGVWPSCCRAAGPHCRTGSGPGRRRSSTCWRFL